MAVVRSLTILGATGSIGRQTLDVVREHRGEFRVSALTVYNQIQELPVMIREFEPERVVVRTKEQAARISAEFPAVEVAWGEEAYVDVAGADQRALVVNALVGSVGIRPTLSAISTGCHVALANKETLVAAGQIVMDMAQAKNVSVIPVDSEHSAIDQCLHGYDRNQVEKLILTASGGPFRGYSQEQLAHVTVANALAHPTWTMGSKVTIDSATLMNKGLEVIEAHFLFDMAYEDISVVVHPQSIIHSLVQFNDGAMIAQLGAPDMRVPIQFAILGREERRTPWQRLDLTAVSQLTFEEPDVVSFPALALAYDCGKAGGTYPAVMNAANEVAARAFLDGNLTFLGIVDIVRRVVDQHVAIASPSIEAIFGADSWARQVAGEMVQEGGRMS